MDTNSFYRYEVRQNGGPDGGRKGEWFTRFQADEPSEGDFRQEAGCSHDIRNVTELEPATDDSEAVAWRFRIDANDGTTGFCVNEPEDSEDLVDKTPLVPTE